MYANLIQQALEGIDIHPNKVTLSEFCDYFKCDYLTTVSQFEVVMLKGMFTTQGKDYAMGTEGILYFILNCDGDEFIEYKRNLINEKVMKRMQGERYDIQNILNLKDGDIRIVKSYEGEQPWFVATDIMRWLRYSCTIKNGYPMYNVANILYKVAEEDKKKVPIRLGIYGSCRTAWIITLNGVKEVINTRAIDFAQDKTNELLNAINLQTKQDIMITKGNTNLSFIGDNGTFTYPGLRMLYDAMYQTYNFLATQYGTVTAEHFISNIQKDFNKQKVGDAS